MTDINPLLNPQWDNTNIYVGFADPKIEKDLSQIIASIDELKALDCTNMSAENLIAAISKKLRADEVVLNVATYANTALSINGKNTEAKNLQSRISSLFSELAKAYTPFEVYLLRCDSEVLDSLYNLSPEALSLKSQLEHQRKMSAYLLSSQEEALIKGFSKDGLTAWGTLYQDLSGSIRVKVGGEELSSADAANLLRQEDRKLREEAWRALNSAWEERSESASAILNSINGWRWEENRQRAAASQKPLHFLDQSSHRNKIDRKTLDTLMAVTYENRHIAQRALKSMAMCLGLKKLSPWDLIAPPPAVSDNDKGSEKVSFPEAIAMIKEAFSELSPKMSDFVQMMYDNNWIDAASTSNRRAGAYCTKFANPREPRVFMTYGGQLSHISTLAHELGHAYHNWVMRDMPLPETTYSMCTAETASIFAETLLKDHLYQKAKDSNSLGRVLWQEAEGAAVMLANIPARFAFEKSLVEKRGERSLSSDEMTELMKQAWAKYYESSLTEYDSMFWATKLHFSIAGLAFYNYPYLFGYLFSLGVYAKKAEYKRLHDKYISLLRDTGTMTAEDLIQKHFNQDIRGPEFWLNSIGIVEQSVIRFEEHVLGRSDESRESTVSH